MSASGPKNLIKRSVDVALAAVALVLFSPLLILIGVTIRLVMGSPVFFRQLRAGFLGRPFRPVKFRTMTNNRDSRGQLLSDGERMTRLGIFLRRFSLDELPQLWNVLVGDLSLVGPRPLLAEYLPLYSAQQARRHEVRPGITGWAQVNGRNNIAWEERFELDVWYVDHWSLILDARILWMTMRKILTGDGIAHKGHVTMEKFLGNGHQKS